MTGLRIGSLCSGYGGLDLAVTAVLGGSVVWVADPDPAATAVLAARYPDAVNLGDISCVVFTTVAALAPVDVVCAGFPCQDISNAGHKAGIEGRHSGVWRHVARAVRVLRPRLLVLENVAALLTRGLGRVLADLAQAGYDAAWVCLRASDIGAPHQRERVFIAAWPADAEGAGLQRAWLPGRAPGHGGVAADADRVRGDRYRPAGQLPQRHLASQGRVVTDAASLGEREPANPPHPLPDLGQARLEPGRRSVRAAAHPEGDGWHQGRPQPARQRRGPDPAVCGGTDWGPYAAAIRRWETLLGRPAPAPTETGPTGKPRLAARFVEWLMGLDAGWVTDVPGLTRNQQLRLLGNGVLPAQGAVALSILLSQATWLGSDAA